MNEQSASKYQFRSDLSQTPLPEVLATIHRYRVPGVIDCHRGSETKSIYIDSGNIIFATSSDVTDSLGDRLLFEAKITMAQYAESVRRLRQDKKRQGTILAEMGAIKPKELFVAVREQVQAIVWSMFEWNDGAVFFEPGKERKEEFIKLNIPIRQAILQGIRSVPDARSLLTRVGGKTTVLQRSDECNLAELTLTPEEEELLGTIDGKKALVDLTGYEGQTGAQNAKTLYAFFALKLISVKAPRQLKVHLRVNPVGDQG
jgi:hypothetical protein